MRTDIVKSIEEDTCGVIIETKSKNRSKEQVREQANVNVTIALTPTQKKELEEYAKKDERSLSFVVRKTLIKANIISEQK